MDHHKTKENDAVTLRVFRRNGKLFVNPMAISPDGFRSLETLLPVGNGKTGLLEALETAEQLALELTRKPRSKRFPRKDEEPDWSVAGVSTWEDFLKGATSVHVMRADEKTELKFFLPRNRDSMGGTTMPMETFGPETPLAKVAAAVVEMFARADETKPKFA
jgi:hypothetical protein